MKDGNPGSDAEPGSGGSVYTARALPRVRGGPRFFRHSEGSFTMVNQKSSIDLTTAMN
jgi:hypothetical protein